MGNKNYEKRKQNERRERKSKEKILRAATWLIICEGKETEPQYFKSLFLKVNEISNNKINIKVEGKGMNTNSLVDAVDDLINYSDNLISDQKIPYGKVFIVFDKDSFPANNFNRAISRCESKGYIPIWSNECIELWFLLHFTYLDSNISREEYFNKLSKLAKQDYKKNADNFKFVGELENLNVAYKNSINLYKNYEDKSSPAKMAPCTTMFRMIDEIEKEIGKEIRK